MKLLMMGPQGSGKGTIGVMLSNTLGLPLIAAGELLRSMSKSDPRYIEAMALMNEGKLAPFELLVDLILSRINLDDCRRGYILDGWARSMENINFFNPGFDKVILLKISKETTLKRLSTRRTCNQCSSVFNVVTKPPKVDGVCDNCGGTLVQRADDTEAAITERLAIYDKQTTPVIEFFKKRGTLLEIDGEGTPEEVFNLIMQKLEVK